MKKQILTALGFLPLVVVAQNTHFTLKAKVSSLTKPAMAYLSYRSGGKSVLDSATSVNGTFQFSGELSGVAKAQLVLDHAGVGISKLGRTADVLAMYLESGTISVAAVDSVKKAVITGSAVNDQNNSYKKLVAAPEQTMNALNAKYMAATADQKKSETFMNDLEGSYNKAEEERKNLQIQFIKQHPDSFVSLMALTDVAGPMMDVVVIDPLYKGLTANVRESATGVEFSKSIEMARATSVGAMAPGFTQNDVNDKPVSLADFRGKYVLLDFWASWCGPCRAENPNVVKAYHQYSSKNFTVLGVSLDQPGKKEAWMGAIKADGLDWTQVSDLKFWNNDVAKQYGIRSIPQNFLIDPNGKIVGKNLRGDALEKKLKEIFGS